MIDEDQAVVIDCDRESMVGILSGGALAAERGVLVVVGGPQYRVGSHRQFLLLARHLAARGVPVLRFDYRGMGDSSGEARTFESVDADIRCAIDRFFGIVPSLKEVVIWGLCDAASAALFYAHRDARVGGVVLLNPWVRTQQGIARAHIRHYYLRRLFQTGLWQKVLRGEFKFREAGSALLRVVSDALEHRPAPSAGQPSAGDSLPDRMQDALRRFPGKVLLILSGSDLTAQEFKDVVDRSSGWRRMLADARVSIHHLPEANHTFARHDWRAQVEKWTEAWLGGLPHRS